jgi:hypothetical protein
LLTDTQPSNEPIFTIENGRLKDSEGRCPPWDLDIYHPLTPIFYRSETTSSVFVLSRDAGIVAKVNIHSDNCNNDVWLVKIPGAEQIVVDRVSHAVYVAVTGGIDLVRLDADWLLRTDIKTGVSATSLTINCQSGILLIAGNDGVARMNPTPPYTISRLRTDGSYGPWLQSSFTGDEPTVLANGGSSTVIKLSTSIPAPTISPTQISFKAFSVTEKEKEKEKQKEKENQTLTLTNQSDVSINLSLPDNAALNGFKAQGNCTVLAALRKCEYVVSPPDPVADEQGGKVQIDAGGKDPLSVELCQPRKGAENAAPANPGMRCGYDGTCETRTFRRQGGNELEIKFSGPDSKYFVATVPKEKCLHPGELCTLTLQYKKGSTNAVPEAIVTVSTTCPGFFDFTAPVRVAPNSYFQRLARKKKR